MTTEERVAKVLMYGEAFVAHFRQGDSGEAFLQGSCPVCHEWTRIDMGRWHKGWFQCWSCAETFPYDIKRDIPNAP